jgi:hypothetical protein
MASVSVPATHPAVDAGFAVAAGGREPLERGRAQVSDRAADR